MYDLVILDESESIIEQFASGLFKKFNDCFATFVHLLRYSARVICLDALLCDRTYNIIKQIRHTKNWDPVY